MTTSSARPCILGIEPPLWRISLREITYLAGFASQMAVKRLFTRPLARPEPFLQ